MEVFRGEGVREPIKRGYLKVAQLRHEGDWQPAPKAMRNLMRAARKAGLDVVLDTKAVYPTAEEVVDYRFLYLHGRNSFAIRKEDLKHLRFNLESGGLLLADACCGSKAFDASFRKLMEDLWAEKKLKLEPIPPDDELYSKELNGTAITTVKCRRESPDGGRPSPEFRNVPPALEGSVERPLGGDLQPLRHRLRPGEAPIARLPGPRPRQRRQAGPGGGPVLVAQVNW